MAWLHSKNKTFFLLQHFNKSDGTPVLIIGHHILNGKLVSMTEPLLVMRKKKTSLSVRNPVQIRIPETFEIRTF